MSPGLRGPPPDDVTELQTSSNTIAPETLKLAKHIYVHLRLVAYACVMGTPSVCFDIKL